MRLRSWIRATLMPIAMSACCWNAAAQSDGTTRFDPSFSADGKRVVFVESVRTGTKSSFTLMTMNVDGSDVKVVTTGQLRSPRFSPDGKWIVFSRVADSLTEDIWITSYDGKNVRQLTHTPDMTEVWPSFTPDGRVAFVRKPTPDATGAILSMSLESPTIGQKELFAADLGISHFHANTDGSFAVVCKCEAGEKGLAKGTSNQVQAFQVASDGKARLIQSVSVGRNDRIASLSASINAKRLMYSVRNSANRGNYVIEDRQSSPSRRQSTGINLAVFDFDIAADGSKIILSGSPVQGSVNGLWLFDFGTFLWSEVRPGKAGTY